MALQPAALSNQSSRATHLNQEKKRMKKLLLLAIASACSAAVWASPSCDRLAKIADDNGTMFGTKYSFVVQGNKGFRTYFHSAPSNQCKIKNLFVIPKDSVIAYQEFKNENQTWLYVMYIDRNGNDTSGWVKARDFKISGSLSPAR